MRRSTNRSDHHLPHYLFPCPGLEFVVSARPQSGAGCHGLSGSPFWFSPAISTRPTGREIPSFFILAIKVVRFSPNLAAAHNFDRQNEEARDLATKIGRAHV